MRGALLAALTVAALLIGLTTGVASLMLHEKSWAWLVLTLAAPAATAVALPAGWLRCGFGLGWIAMVFVAVQGRPEGDYVVLASPRGYTLLVFCLLLLVGLVVTLPVRRRPGESGSGTTGT